MKSKIYLVSLTVAVVVGLLFTYAKADANSFYRWKSCHPGAVGSTIPYGYQGSEWACKM